MKVPKKIHFIAIGGAAMHNLALALKKIGHQVSGSDDEIFEPSYSRLNRVGLLPSQMGWDADRITSDIEIVILGMHARLDNPELIRAKELGLKVMSYPEFLYEQTKNKKRIAIGGSHGKTTITAMIMHVFKTCGLHFDYMVGSQIDGFETMVSLSEDAEWAIFEGDEYLSSPLDLRPKFLHYKPHLAVLSGIAWDHINVFPSFEEYKEQFLLFMQSLPSDGKLFWYEGDQDLKELASDASAKCKCIPYAPLKYSVQENQLILERGSESYPLQIIGEHNIQNLGAAMHICNEVGISGSDFYKAVASFKGTAKRMQLLAANGRASVYLDFAHSPSKVKATVESVKRQFPGHKLYACLELHTFSSLNKDFLPEYQGSLEVADKAFVFYNPEVVRHKRLPEISVNDVLEAFKKESLEVYTEKSKLKDRLQLVASPQAIYLMMSSGNFGGMNMDDWAKQIVSIVSC